MSTEKPLIRKSEPITAETRVVTEPLRILVGLVLCEGHWYALNDGIWQQVDDRQAIAALQTLAAVPFVPGCPSILGQQEDGPYVH